jgi:putative oxidoreductase
MQAALVYVSVLHELRSGVNDMAGRTVGLGLGWLTSYAYAALRIIAGLLYACHGAQKLFGVLGGHRVPLISQFGAAGMIEFSCGLLIALGLLTSIAAFLASGEMAVAFFQVHAPRGFWPIQNGGELAVLYCFLFLYIATRGAGTWAINRGAGSV